jgi:hypothetical protein
MTIWIPINNGWYANSTFLYANSTAIYANGYTGGGNWVPVVTG